MICNSYRCCKLPVKSINFDRALKILIDSAFVMKLLIQFFFLTDLKVNATIKMIIMALIIRPMNSLSFSYVVWIRPKSLLLGAAASQVLRLETKGVVIEELSVKRVFNIQCTPVKPLTYLSWMIYCRRVFHLYELVEMSSFRMRIDCTCTWHTFL